MKELKYTYSQLSSSSVPQLVSCFYDIGSIKKCCFYVLGLHDNYLIETESDKFILRVYRNDWRSPEEVHFELTLLNFLQRNGAPVAAPVANKYNKLYFEIECPEGNRLITIFPYAEGVAPGRDISLSQSKLLGCAVANTHQCADEFKSEGFDKVLEIQYLLDQSVSAINPYLSSEQKAYIETLQIRLKESLPIISKSKPAYGICLGDVNPTNFHINVQQQITLFDFDQCGYGYRAFEIGKFNSSIGHFENHKELSRAFLSGYQSIRQLSNEELFSISFFEIISHIWVMAIHAYNADRVGYKWLEKPFWDKRLAVIKDLEEVLD